VVKHAQTDKILVRLSHQNQLLKLTIEDFGVGFDANKEFSGLGMKSLKNRVDMMGGELDIQSTLGKGTRIEIVLPQENHP
jgi:signal transduction histidine kinase